ncbi:hypothetical protein Btru_038840 [Bulinus truncatus]|nr:hypothetical protein Btru_038840 [Bulinus truncatus]
MFAKFDIQNQSYGSWDELSYFPVFIFNLDIITTFNDITVKIFIPSISILGVSGNIISIAILYRHGLDKCSNILICSLAVADSMYLVGINNFPLFLYDSASHYGFFYNESLATFVYTLFLIFVLLETVGKVVSMVLPTLIIVERFTAVFFPLRFSQIVTQSRIKVAVVMMYPLGLAAFILYVLPVQFTYVFDPTVNCTVGYVIKSDTYFTSYQVFGTATLVYTTLCGPVCVGFVTIGCVLISVKVQIQLQVRKRMTTSSVNAPPHRAAGHLTGYHQKALVVRKINANVQTNKTTKILLSVCVVYAVTGSFNFLSDMVFNMEKMGFITGFIIHRSGILFLCINSTANFIIYVAFNRNFRKTYKEMFLRSPYNRA